MALELSSSLLLFRMPFSLLKTGANSAWAKPTTLDNFWKGLHKVKKGWSTIIKVRWEYLPLIFFSAAPTAQISPELNICFTDFCIQWSVVLYTISGKPYYTGIHCISSFSYSWSCFVYKVQPKLFILVWFKPWLGGCSPYTKSFVTFWNWQRRKSEVFKCVLLEVCWF